MPRRIDINGGDPQNEIEEALRQLTHQQRQAEPDREIERAVQEVAEQQRDSAALGPKKRSRVASRLAWVGLICVVVALVTVSIVMLRPEPPPPPAKSAEEVVRNFWTYLIQGKYEAATSYWPQLQSRYGSAAQAGRQLRDQFAADPPTSLRKVEVGAPAESSGQYDVHYEVYTRSGQLRMGDFTVTDTGTASQGFIITAGAVG